MIPGASDDTSATGDLDLVNPVTIQGAGADKTTISSWGNNDRILDVPHFATGPITISDVTIRDGVAEIGAGISVQSIRNGVRALEQVTLRRVHITSNHANRDGGGIWQYGAALTLIDSTLSRNFARESGGGLFLNTTATLSNVTVSGNTAVVTGGGIHIELSFPDETTIDIRILSSTITENAVGGTDGGAGIFAFEATTVRNTILAGNLRKMLKGDVPAPDCFGGLIADAYNVIGINEGCDGVGGTDQFGTPEAPLSPKLSGLGGGPPGSPKPPTTANSAGTGGPTPTHALLGGSPAIDRGSPSPPGTSDTSCAAMDQRGMPRTQSGACDVGAYELALCLGVPVNRIGTPGPDNLQGTFQPDVFLLFSGDDTVKVGDGDNIVCAGEGNDVVFAGGENDLLDGGPGVDTVSYSDLSAHTGLVVDLLNGTAGGAIVAADHLVGFENAIGSSGRDIIRGGMGPNILIGRGGNDALYGRQGDDVLIGSHGADRVAGNSGDDQLVGRSGSDHMTGGPGDDSLRGGPGHDRLRGGQGFDFCVGGQGRDHTTGCETSFPSLK
jgi:Ca2+-binding RTX toxin-like protein